MRNKVTESNLFDAHRESPVNNVNFRRFRLRLNIRHASAKYYNENESKVEINKYKCREGVSIKNQLVKLGSWRDLSELISGNLGVEDNLSTILPDQLEANKGN